MCVFLFIGCNVVVYVCGEKFGILLEKIFKMGEMLNFNGKLVIEIEMELMK